MPIPVLDATQGGPLMAVLTAAARRAIPKKDFAVPGKAPKSGSYPIPDAAHARNALARSSGKPVAAMVRRKVAKKFPGIGKAKKALAPMGEMATRTKRAADFEKANGDQAF
jgi:hypothetical protein